MGEHFRPLWERLDILKREGRAVNIAIDGRCGSGKSTLGAEIVRRYGARLFHTDDYYTSFARKTPERLAQPGGNCDHERLLSELLLPERGEILTWRRFDPFTQTLLPAETVPANPLTVIEGSYALQEDLRAHYDLRVFLDISPALQRERIRVRNGEEGLKAFIEKWIPLEEAYFATGIRELCDFVIRVD